ncbi:hypothetical protein J2Y55_001110 [Bosea sp. BE125]|uniref:hypothetical protein n=1 Tax=Bosea sp. BE125 TaxID=2817909 RepID=UPI00285ACB78|nr:hypothetical protein [Bosea sp. BE125]MDR6870110.1 hypothetical protein [Bosea sp. BE125]
MSDLAEQAWAVAVDGSVPGGVPYRQIFYVGLDTEVECVAAVKADPRAADYKSVQAMQRLSANDIAGIGLRKAEVRSGDQPPPAQILSSTS